MDKNISVCFCITFRKNVIVWLLKLTKLEMHKLGYFLFNNLFILSSIVVILHCFSNTHFLKAAKAYLGWSTCENTKNYLSGSERANSIIVESFWTFFDSLKMAASKSSNKVSVVLGSQWGDEGKGPFICIINLGLVDCHKEFLIKHLIAFLTLTKRNKLELLFVVFLPLYLFILLQLNNYFWVDR